MNNDLEQFSEKRLRLLADYSGTNAELQWGEIEALARIALSVKQAEAVAQVYQPANIGICAALGPAIRMINVGLPAGTLLYTTPQPAHTEQGKAVANEFLPENLDRALTIMGVALPESKEEFNFQAERWMQRLINRVIRYEEEVQSQESHTEQVIPDNVRDALEKALSAMQFMGDTLNNLDAVCAEDVEHVTPAFEAIRKLLAAAPKPESE